MKRISQKPRKKLGIILIALFCIVLIPKNLLAQGPNAPEAASFEPVDATDMVNLVTGDLSYVLPLLNVPSPEGGYPIALSYHAGIAMDQEASWVGLGWSLNPGAINRGINGYPDDWGKTNVNEFFYDKGWTEHYYSFGAGVTLGGGVSVGIGLSWGSDQSLGGYVSASIGLEGGDGDYGSPSIGIRIGTDGFSINGGAGGFSASVGTNGVGIGYGFSKDDGDNVLGVSLNYSYNSGLSGGVSFSSKTGTFENGASKSSGMGISFSSEGVSMNAKINGYGAGISSSAGGVSAGDYDVQVSTSGFFIPAYIFYISYSHTKVKYSLYKYNNLYTSGMLYPVAANTLRTYDDNSGLSRWLNENHFMDVNIMQRFGENDLHKNLIDDANKNDRNNLVLPNYDNYSVHAQGLSGTISPYIHSEINLSGRGRGEQNSDNEYVSYLNHDISEYMAAPSSGLSGGNKDAVAKKYFTFTSEYNSFLRLEKSNIYKNYYSLPLHSDNIMKDYKSGDSYNFYNSPSLKGKRKREGNTIETFTNKEIRDNTIVGFIDAKEGNNLLNRQDTDVFLDEGIGAFQITTLDGKTYHYSLPVYQFESFYKNFKNKDDEDKNFFEIQKTTPYATHWLLTAITGPDYIDFNNNGKVDKEDYGYWVEFDYGKWSDGYVWQSPNGRFEEIEDKDDPDDITYSYSWGRKQIYYLDAIKTRTHTALFIKEIRKDSKSEGKTINNGNHFIPREYSLFKLLDYGKYYEGNPKESTNIGKPGGVYFDDDEQKQSFLKFAYPVYNDWAEVDHYDFTDDGNINRELYPVNRYYSKLKKKIDYWDIPENKSLSLKKIILLKNEDFNIGQMGLKSNGSLEKDIGYFSSSIAFFNPQFECIWFENNGDFETGDIEKKITGSLIFKTFPDNLDPSAIFLNKSKLIEINLNDKSMVIDNADIANLNLEEKASQIIDFTHNYSLAKGAPNTEEGSGRLTLKTVNYKGKGGVQLVPPYQFDYYANTTSYYENYIDDWGYRKYSPQVWSLNKITTPTGGNIKIDYGSDKYYAEAAHSEEPFFSVSTTSKESENTNKITFRTGSPNALDHFQVNRSCFISVMIEEEVENQWGEFYTERDFYKIQRDVIAIGSNWIIVEGDIPLTNQDTYDGRYIEIVKGVYGNATSLATDQSGGGIRTNSITVSDGINNIATTEYIYKNGITSYAPTKEQKGVPYVAELPAPMVMYGEVTMTTKDKNNTELGSTVYTFETLDPRKEEDGYIFSLGEAFRVKENQEETFESNKVYANKFTIESKLGNLGRIKSITSYNSKNQVLNKKNNYYKYDLDSEGEIGVTQESHISYKRVKKGSEKFYVSSTSKINYPSVLQSTKTSQDGFSIQKYFDKYDFLTGQLLETRTYASDGTAFKTLSVPAYTKYPAMGSKIDNTNYKNMLTQQAAAYTYLLDENDAFDRVLSAGITTWNNDWTYRDASGNESSITEVPVWRKHKSYFWEGEADDDGAYIGFNKNNDDDFQWGVGQSQTNPKWKQASEITRYDHFSAPLENKDINGNYASSKMCDDNSKIMTVSNAKYTEMFYSGAEYISEDASYFDGEVKSYGLIENADNPHTGNNIVRISGYNNAFEVVLPHGKNRKENKFKVSVWVRKGSEYAVRIKVGNTLSNFEEGETITAGNWVLLNGYIDVPYQETVVAIAVFDPRLSAELDDFRLHPISSSMSSYVYNEWDELWYIIGNNGLYSKYEYDEAGRLIKVFSEVVDTENVNDGFKLVKEIGYTYKSFIDMDTNGNGVLDLSEQYDDLYLSVGPYNTTSSTITLKAYVTGGSGNFQYRWAKSSSSTNLNFGSWTTSNEVKHYWYCSNDTRRVYYKCEVKDLVTGVTILKTGNHFESCGDGGNGDGIKDIKKLEMK